MPGHVDLPKERYTALRESPREGAVHLLNLIRLRDRAEYPDGRDASGVQAYQSYGRISEPVLARFGAKIVWEGRFESILTGPDDESWDLHFVAEYPTLAAFIDIAPQQNLAPQQNCRPPIGILRTSLAYTQLRWRRNATSVSIGSG